MAVPDRETPAAARAGPLLEWMRRSPGVATMSAQRRGAAAEPADDSVGGPRVLKKYPNRRLYDTRSSSYITLADVKDMVLKLEDFEVRDAKTGEDLTRSILLQIILDEESGGVPMFSSQMLSQMIRFYGHSMQGMMGAYLEKNLQTFVELQKRFAASGMGLNDAKAFTPETWAQFMTGQGSAMQGLVGAYLEQSKSLFTQMQEQMAKQAGTLFQGIPGLPGTKRPG
jgi:polyhydroxyalkanoate synthesis repressor PhaR